MAKLTPKELTSLIIEAQCQYGKNKSLRLGQCYFNTALNLCPDLANQIRGDGCLDPFYCNDNIGAFINWLCQ